MSALLKPVQKVLGFFLGGKTPPTPTARRADPIQPQELSSEYGTGITRVWGRARVPAVVLWAGSRRDLYSTSTRTWQYHQSFLVSFGTPVDWIEKIWFDTEEWDLGVYGSNQITPDPPTPLDRMRVYHRGGESPHPRQSFKRESAPVRRQGNVVERLLRRAFGDDVPAFTDHCYIAIEYLYLNKFGGRLPKITAQVVRASSGSLDQIGSTIIKDVAEECGLSSTQIVTPGTGVNVSRGYRRDEDAEGKELIYRVSQAEGWEPVERYTGIEMILTSADDSVTEIDDSDLIVFDRTNIYQEERSEESEIPEIIELTYADPERDYQTSAARARHIRGATTGYTTGTREKDSISWPMTLSAQSAKRIVNRWLDTARAERVSASFRLPARFLFLEPGDVIRLTLAAIGQIVRLRLQTVEIGADNTIHVVAVRESLQQFEQTQEAEGGRIVLPILSSNLEPTLFVLDIPVLSAEADPRPQSQQVNLYWVPTLRVPAVDWPGCRLFYLRSVGDIPEISISRPLGAPSGRLKNGDRVTPPLGDMEHWRIDTKNQIVLRSPYRDTSFVSAPSFRALVDGANLGAIIKKNALGVYTGEIELIQFMSVRKVSSPNEIVLYNLLRGRYGTDTMAQNHGPDEDFVLLDEGDQTPAFRFRQDQVDGTTPIRYYTINLGTTADVTTLDPKLEQVLIGRSLAPFAPVRIRAKKVLNTVEISWIRRGRYNSDLQRGFIPYTERDKDGLLFLGYRVEILHEGDTYDSEIAGSPITLTEPDLRALTSEGRQLVTTALVDSRNRPLLASGKAILNLTGGFTDIEVGDILMIRLTQLDYNRDSGFGTFQSVVVE